MKVRDIVKLVNTYLAGEQLTYNKLIPYLDAVIDEINSNLSSTYPVFSTLPVDSSEASYNFFPDKYVRNVVCVGAAYKFYLVDEEGVDEAGDLGDRYNANLFYMVRDFIEEVPEYYRSDTKGSVIIREDVPPVIIECPHHMFML